MNRRTTSLGSRRWLREDWGIVRGARRAFTLVELLVVIGIIALLIAILMPALSRARKQALQVSCGSNERQTVISAIAYANDWKEMLPTRLNAPTDVGAYWPFVFATRLPIIGFDTTTIINPLPGLYEGPMFVGAGLGLGGWSYMLRDYLKNDGDVVICPDGWFTHEQVFRKYEGTDLAGTDAGYVLILGSMWRSPVSTGIAGLGYLWLPHRNTFAKGSVVPGGVTCPTPRGNVDGPADNVKKASSLPELLVTTDIIFWQPHTPGDYPRIFANHQATDVTALHFRDANAPAFTPCDISATNPLNLPLGTNVTRLDCRVTWKPMQDVEVFRYADHPADWEWYSW